MSNSHTSVVVDKKIGANFRNKTKRGEERGGEEGQGRGEEEREEGRKRKISYSFRN